MYNIIINEDDKFSKQFALSDPPHVEQKLRLMLKDSDTNPEVFQVSHVSAPPTGLSGVFTHQVILRKIKARVKHSRMRTYMVTEYN